MTLLKDLARAKITFQARTLATILNEGMDMTDQSKHDQMLTLVDRLRSIPPRWVDTTICTEVADALTALLGENKRLRCALKPLADEAFQNMAGGKGHLIDDAYYALKGDDQ